MGFNGIWWDLMGFNGIYDGLLSGKPTKTMEHHHFIAGKINELWMAIFNSNVKKSGG